MPRKRIQGEASAAVGGARVDPPVAPGNLSGLPSLYDLSTRDGRLRAASLELTLILSRADGWLRLIPGSDGEVSYWKWKFVTGQHSGKYVMYVNQSPDWVEGVLGLATKLGKVDEGTLKPTVDSYYDGV